MTAPRETDEASRGAQDTGDRLRIGIIGGGLLGEAFVRGLVRSGVATPRIAPRRTAARIKAPVLLRWM